MMQLLVSNLRLVEDGCPPVVRTKIASLSAPTEHQPQNSYSCSSAHTARFHFFTNASWCSTSRWKYGLMW